MITRILIDDKKQTVLISNLLLATSTIERMKGLLGYRKLPEGTGMLIRPCRSIHMWFMRISIDAAFLDKEMRVLKISRRLPPWSMAFAPLGTHSVLEANADALSHLQRGTKLIIQEET